MICLIINQQIEKKANSKIDKYLLNMDEVKWTFEDYKKVLSLSKTFTLVMKCDVIVQSYNIFFLK